MPFNIGAPEVLLVLVVALLVLGPKRLPEVGAALGKTIREFRQAVNEAQEPTSASGTTSAPPPAGAGPVAPPATPEPDPAATASSADASSGPSSDHRAAA